MKRLMLAALAAGVWTTACSSATTPTPTGGASGTSGTSTTADAGGTSTADDAGAGSQDAATGPFKLTSATLTEGGTFPKESTCNATPQSSMASPPFTWTPGPPGTKSYALVLVDTSNGLAHSAMYDIPATVFELPKGVERKYQPAVPAGAKQTKAYDGVTFGYLGPCPPTGEHVYQFTLYALDVDTLPNMTQNTDAKTCNSEAKKRALGFATLTAKYKQ